MTSNNTISILGCGWLGKPLAVSLIRRGFRVLGSTTSPEKLAELEAAGIHPFLIRFTPELDGEADMFFRSPLCIVSIPPAISKTNPSDFMLRMSSICEELLKGGTTHVVFISSTSVYNPGTEELKESDADINSILFKAEELFTNEKKFSTTVIRFAGLVGPGRHPSRFLSGKEVAGGNDPVNLIHLNDCIGIITAVIKGDCWNKVYNACADMHPTRRDFYTWVCRQKGVPLPVFISPDDHAPKRVSNALIRRDLAYTFQFPDPMTMTY